MRINDNSRPKEITSNEIWELYKLFEGLDEHYVFYDRCGAPKNREELFYFAGTRLGGAAMATYVISDIHGEYDMLMDLLEKISLQDSDTLYVLGDVLDRGPHPIKTLRKLMVMPNVICLVGNHELMALESLKFLMQEITTENIKKLDPEMLDGFLVWVEHNGGKTTMDEFKELSLDDKKEVIEYLQDFLVYEEIEVAGKDYLLVHAGLGGFDPEKDIEDYSLKEIVWDRAEYDICYYKDKYVITGHTPTHYIYNNPNPGYIYRKNNHIAIDCGAYMSGGRLAAMCLDTGKEYYSYPHER